MTTLFDALVETARRLDLLWEGTAASGSALSLADDHLGLLGYAPDAWKGGQVWLISGSPSNESRPVLASGSSGTVTPLTAFSAPVQSGAWFALSSNRWPRGLLAAKVNEALTALGGLVREDTSLSGDGESASFTLPETARADLRQVWLAESGSAPWRWRLSMRWRQIGDSLAFATPPPALPIRLVYVASHPRVEADGDLIDAAVPVAWLAAEAALRAARSGVLQPARSDLWLEMLRVLEAEAALMRLAHRTALPPRTPTIP
jgi:hypothetical protein